MSIKPAKPRIPEWRWQRRADVERSRADVVPAAEEVRINVDEKDADGSPVLTHRYGFHMLRHAAASLFIQYLGWTPKRLQTVMGHSSITMTFDLYGHMFENVESDRADMAKTEAVVRAA
jgi:integrase